MPSRMDRYYKANTPVKKRTYRNEGLYKKIYDIAEYSNIEGITNIERTNEIDLLKIKELLNNSNEDNREKSRHRIVSEPKTIVEQSEEKEEQKNYDIRDVLNKAKGERDKSSGEYHSLRNTQYNILKGLKLKEGLDSEEYFEAEEELKELINTITSTSMLNKLGDDELSLNILDELRSNGNTTVNDPKSIKEVLEQEKKIKQTEDEENEIDRSFYTSSLNFKEEDFDELKDINVTLKRNNILIKSLLFILLIIIIAGTGFVIYNFLI